MSASDGAGRLCEQDAWAIAMTWEEPLRRAVYPVTDQDDPVEIILGSYAWVFIDLQRIAFTLLESSTRSGRLSKKYQAIEAPSIARAAVRTWLALQQCAGYGCHENPTFWKRVFKALHIGTIKNSGIRVQRYRGPRPSPPPPMSDAIGFFDDQRDVFARIMVKPPGLADQRSFQTATRVFCGVPGYDVLARVATKLASILAQLRPHMDTTQNVSSALVDVCVVTEPFVKNSFVPNLPELVTDVNTTTASTFQIVHVHFQDSTQRYHRDDTMRDLPELTQTLSVRIGSLRAYAPPRRQMSNPQRRASWVNAVVGLDGTTSGQAKVSSIDVPRNTLPDDWFSALVSALPFTSCLHSVHFIAKTCGTPTFEAHDLPWIAYALFHPKAEHSTWRHLTLSGLSACPQASSVLQAMARGNNLLALLQKTNTSPQCDFYYSGQLAGGVIVRTWSTPNASALITVPETETPFVVDICGMPPSLATASWSEWVGVVIPAYGLGWVRGSQLGNVQACPPSPSTTLSSLCLHRDTRFGAIADPLDFLGSVGPSLTYLDIESYGNVSSLVLGRILHACPLLKSLVVAHNGEYWSNSGSLLDPDCQSPPHASLEELQLILSEGTTRLETPTKEQLQSSLGRLRVLCLQPSSRNLLETSLGAIEQFLSHAHSLTHFHWCYITATTSSQSALTRSAGSSVLERFRLTASQYRFAQGPLSASCAAAFLSVVAVSNSALVGFVDRDLLSHIFQFSTSPVPRKIYLDNLPI